MKPTITPRYLAPKDAARYLGVGLTTLNEKRQEFESLGMQRSKVGRIVRFDRLSLDRVMERLAR